MLLARHTLFKEVTPKPICAEATYQPQQQNQATSFVAFLPNGVCQDALIDRGNLTDLQANVEVKSTDLYGYVEVTPIF